MAARPRRAHPPPTSGVKRSPRVESTSAPTSGPLAMPTLNDAEYQAEAMSVRRGATTRTWVCRAMATPERPIPAPASRTTVAAPTVPKAVSRSSDAASTATGPTLAATGWRSMSRPVTTMPPASAAPVSSSTGATARSGRPLTRVRNAVT